MRSPVTTVRRSTFQDAAEIGEAHASAWEVGYIDLFEPDVLHKAVTRRRGLWTHLMDSSTFDFDSFLVAEQNGLVVGFSQFGGDEEDDQRGEILAFYLRPSAWGSGAASQLMATSLTRLEERGLESVVVWAHSGAHRARAFYTKSGFAFTGLTRDALLNPNIVAPE